MSKYTHQIERSVFEFLADYVQDPVVPLILAVSGGVDSMVLLFICKMFARTRNLPLHVVHINHGLRKSAVRDEQMLQRTCTEWGIPIHVRHVDFNTLSPQERRGVEADARELRYRKLVEVARELQASSVVLAHHADDQIETLLWRFTRGTSVSGLAGMRAKNDRLGIVWLRPMLEIPKEWIVEYANQHSIPYVVDETNTDVRFTRNYLRHEVIPKLRHLQPTLHESVTHLTQLVQQEDDFLESLAKDIVNTCCEFVNGRCRIVISRFLDTPRPLQRRAIKIILYCLASGEYSQEHIESCIGLMERVSPSGVVHLPNGIMASRSYDMLSIGPLEEPVKGSYFYRWELSDGASMEIEPNHSGGRGWRFSCRSWTQTEGVRAKSLCELRIPKVFSVNIRSPETSERVALLGSPGSKKIQDVFTDAKVPRDERSSWPVFYVDEQIVWLPGLMRSRCSLLDEMASDGWVIYLAAFHT